ncbi:hypothetical protein [Bradyrhizobium prioriisuperbiae]|uniref:hypothetical protein n=1 Tax=Bradyrhizobium prioriisuperbiae TaxID=2854389 RepID=UPI0028ED2FD6|nr:hypothetical protein [Bradyrhizobium prioritasuperba]
MVQLRGRVGRHANTGIHCQNWKDDQEVVIGLLNGIPVADGGAWHGLNGRVVAGIASEPLYRAILLFEKKHFRHQSGFVDPNGKMFPLMLKLGTRSYLPPPPPAAPPPKGQWDDLKSASVLAGLRKGLEDDGSLSQGDIVEIIRSTLSDGIVSATELADLSVIATTSRSISPRSKKMLTTFVTDVGGTIKERNSLATVKQQWAADRACDFLKGSGGKSFPHLDRDEVGLGLLMRIANPGLLNQGKADLCGPAAMLYEVASDNPGRYAKFAIDLFENGKASINNLDIKPGSDLRTYNLPSDSGLAPVDWMTMASLRDSENWLYDYNTYDDEDSGTKSKELSQWFAKSGYSDVRNTVDEDHADQHNIEEASRLFGLGYSVCLSINACMLNAATQTDTSKKHNHLVVLQSQVDLSGGNARLKIFTWGQRDFQVPQGAALTVEDFLKNYYGFVAGKP